MAAFEEGKDGVEVLESDNMRRGTLLLTLTTDLGLGLFGNAAEIPRRARSMPAAGDVFIM